MGWMGRRCSLCGSWAKHKFSGRERWFILIGCLTYSWLFPNGIDKMTNKLMNTASACLDCTADGGMTKCSHHLCGCTDCEIHHCACARASILMCRFRPSLSSNDVWAQWLVVFLSEAPIVLCVGHACERILAFIRKCQSGARYIRNKESLVFSLFLIMSWFHVRDC